MKFHQNFCWIKEDDHRIDLEFRLKFRLDKQLNFPNYQQKIRINVFFKVLFRSGLKFFHKEKNSNQNYQNSRNCGQKSRRHTGNKI